MKNMIGEIKDIETFINESRTELKKHKTIFAYPVPPKEIEKFKKWLLAK